jgi:hypothetical protein
MWYRQITNQPTTMRPPERTYARRTNPAAPFDLDAMGARSDEAARPLKALGSGRAPAHCAAARGRARRDAARGAGDRLSLADGPIRRIIETL